MIIEMTKTGRFFISAIAESEFIASVWDPDVYRRDGKRRTLSDFVAIRKVGPTPDLIGGVAPDSLPFGPLEYRDIPRGHYLSFALRPKGGGDAGGWPIVGEGELLFGTLRAYLGNVVVTPLAGWVDRASPVYFPVKSEFVVVSPRDELPYFWLAYLRSKDFLENLPLGSGGTRPRLQPQALGQMPVKVPPRKVRKAVHEELRELAREEWENCLRIALSVVRAHHSQRF